MADRAVREGQGGIGSNSGYLDQRLAAVLGGKKGHGYRQTALPRRLVFVPGFLFYRHKPWWVEPVLVTESRNMLHLGHVRDTDFLDKDVWRGLDEKARDMPIGVRSDSQPDVARLETAGGLFADRLAGGQFLARSEAACWLSRRRSVVVRQVRQNSIMLIFKFSTFLTA